MALFDTSSDDGRRSAILTEKFTCEVCGKIKPFYNVQDSKRANEETIPDKSEKEEQDRILICQCDKETYLQWLRRIVGFGPKRVEDGHKNNFLNRWYPGETSKLQTGAKSSKRGSKAQPCDVQDPQVKVDSVRTEVKPSDQPIDDTGLATFTAPDIQPAEVRAETDADEQSQTSRESKVKKKKRRRRKSNINVLRYNSDTDAAFQLAQLKKIQKEKFGVPASAASVFQKYRSRAHYIHQPEQFRNALKHNRAAKNIEQGHASKNKQQSAVVGGSNDCPGETGNTNLSSAYYSVLGTNCSASHFETYTAQEPILSSRSGPQAERDYRRPPMTSAFFSRTSADEHLLFGVPRRRRFSGYNSCSFRSYSEPCRSISFNLTTEKRPPLGPSRNPIPYPMVLCSSPSFRKASQDQKRGDLTANPRQKQSSWPCVQIASKSKGQKIVTSSLFPSKRKGSKVSASCSRGGCRGSIINCTETGCHLTTKSELKQARFRKSPPRCRTSSPASRCYRQRKATNLRGMYCQNSLILNEERNSKLRRETTKISDIIQRCNAQKRPPRSCPPICIGTCFSPCPNGYLQSAKRTRKKQSTVLGLRRMSSAGGRPMYGLNYTQSSNPSESGLCSKCRTPIQLKNSASTKMCKCAFVLAPTCVKRRGPRSTVSEYLSTIEHPKPLPRAKLFLTKSQIRKNGPEKIVEQDDEKARESVGSAKSTGKTSKRGKKKVTINPTTVPETDQATQVSEEGDPDSIAMPATGQTNDGNNNYGLEISTSLAPHRPSTTRYTEHSAYKTPARVSSVPAQSFTSYVDSGYTPYSSSYGRPTSYGNNKYSPSGNVSYLRAAQASRRTIRDHYEQRRLFTERVSAPHNANLNAWRSSSHDGHVAQFQSWSPDVHMVNVQMRSPEKPRRKKVEIAKNKSIGLRKSSKSRLETTSLRQKHDIKTVPLSTSPALKSSVPPYFPRKSFVEGEGPIDIVNQQKWDTENSLNKNASKAQLVKSPIAEVKKVKNVVQTSLSTTEEGLDTAKNALHEASIGDPIKKDIDGPNDCCETQEVETKNCSDTQDNKTAKAAVDQGVEEEQREDDLGGEKSPETQVQMELTANLNGKESSVDSECPKTYTLAKITRPLPSTVRKIEPRGNLLKILLPESSSASIADQTSTASSVAPTTAPTIPNTSRTQSLISTNANSGDGQNLFQAYAANTKQIPVFQNLMERFSENVQICVRTKDDDGGDARENKNIKIVLGDARDVEMEMSSGEVAPGSKPNPDDDTEAINAVGREKNKSVTNESIAALSPHNKSKNRASPSCEATSKCVSWSDVDHVTHAGVKQQPSLACSHEVQTASAVPPSSTVAPNQSVASLRAASGDPASYAASKAKNYEMEVAICTTTERVYMEKMSGVVKPASDILRSIKQSVLGFDKTLNCINPTRELDAPVDACVLNAKRGCGTYVIHPTNKICSGAGELGEGEEPVKRLYVLPRPRKSRSDATSMWAYHKSVDTDVLNTPLYDDKGSVGSSVDPSPNSQTTVVNQDILGAITGSQTMFQRVTGDGCDGAMIMTAKSRFLRNMRGESMTDIPCSAASAVKDGGPLDVVLCRSLDNASPSPRRQKGLVRVGSLTEAVKKFISLHGTPV